MTLDEAIEHWKRVSAAYDKAGNTDDAMETMQLAEWLRYARGSERFERWATNKIQGLDAKLASAEAENRRLRELVRAMYYSIEPSRRKQLLINVAELGIEVDE